MWTLCLSVPRKLSQTISITFKLLGLLFVDECIIATTVIIATPTRACCWQDYPSLIRNVCDVEGNRWGGRSGESVWNRRCRRSDHPASRVSNSLRLWHYLIYVTVCTIHVHGVGQTQFSVDVHLYVRTCVCTCVHALDRIEVSAPGAPHILAGWPRRKLWTT